MAESSGEGQPSRELLGPALVSFAVDGVFPEDDVSSLRISPEGLPAAISALGDAKLKLEEEIHAINQETADDVNTWFENAKTLQDDISRSRQIANDIQRQSEEPDASGKTIQDAEEKADFLVRELDYNYQLLQSLRGIKAINVTLDQVEQARSERRILDALHLLEKSWTQLDALSVSSSCKAIKLLNLRAFELKSDVHEVFDHVWNALVHVDSENGQLSVQQIRGDEPMSLSHAVIGLQAYREVEQRMAQLWHDLDKAIVGPRMDIRRKYLPAVHVDDKILGLRGESDRTVKSLFTDLQKVFTFLAAVLPADLVEAISTVMMPDVTARITSIWLDSAVPSSLAEMGRFEEVIDSARDFCASLLSLKYSGFGDLQDWVDSAPKVWLSKCRETALDTVRQKLSQGLGDPRQVERVETQMVSRSEGKELAANANGPSAADNNQDWDLAWSDGDEDGEESKAPEAAPDAEDDGADAWGAWGEEGEKEITSTITTEDKDKEDEDEGDAAEAWGWGEDDGKDESERGEPAPELAAEPKASQASQALASTSARARSGGTREMTLKETYTISSMPDPVLSLISSILEDGAALTKESHESNPVAAAAAGLFSVPTLVLAMFRAISPYFYSSELGGNMFLYNDATYVAEKLNDFASSWKKREDLTPRAQNMLRIDKEVRALEGFAARAYSNEMNIQKTIIRDLLGGEQSVMQQSFIESAVAQIRSVAAAWEDILARSAWFQAVGSLVDAVATKVVADVMEMPSIGQDEAYNIANMIARITELDDLFPPVPGGGGGGEGVEAAAVPTTAQYAPSWLRLKYLSEVLQSNLREVRYLWMESELSLYFTVDEVVDLINVSFEDNARTREILREIKHNPQPIQE